MQSEGPGRGKSHVGIPYIPVLPVTFAVANHIYILFLRMSGLTWPHYVYKSVGRYLFRYVALYL